MKENLQKRLKENINHAIYLKQQNLKSDIKETFKIPNLLKPSVASIETEEIDIDIDIIESQKKIKSKQSVFKFIEANKTNLNSQVVINNKKLIQQLNDLSIPSVIIDNDSYIQYANISFISIMNENASSNDEFTLNYPSLEQYIKEDDLDVYHEYINHLKTYKTNDTIPRKLSFNISHSKYSAYRVKIETIIGNSELYVIYFTDGQLIYTKAWYIIEPRGVFYLVWVFLTILTLIYIVFSITIEYSFYPIWYKRDWDIYIDEFITYFYAFDILLNFFVAYVDSNNNFIYNHSKIIKNYAFNTNLLVDIIATIPFDRFLNIGGFNTQILKIIRSMKIVKLLRLSKFVAVYNMKDLLGKSEIAQELGEFFDRNIGYLELFKSMGYLILITHFYVCIHFYVKTNIIEHENIDWIADYFYYPSYELGPYFLYFYLLSQHLKTALGLQLIDQSVTYTETWMNITWMIIGLSMFGYGIGNISSYINYSNKKEYELTEAINYFKDIATENGCEDPDLMQEVYNEVTYYYNNYNINKFKEYSTILSESIRVRLEYALYYEFINSYPLFTSLKFEVIKRLKICPLVNRSIVYQYKSPINSVYFIIEGYIKIISDGVEVKSYYKEDVLGLRNFVKYYNQKFDIDLLKMVKNTKESYNPSKKIGNDLINNFSGFKKNLYNKILTNQVSNFKTSNTINKIVPTEHINTASAFDNPSYLEVSFEALEDIRKIDFDSFLRIFEYWDDRNQILSDDYKMNLINDLKTFNNNLQMGLLIEKDGKINSYNRSFLNQSKYKQIDYKTMFIIEFDKNKLKYNNELKIKYENSENIIVIKNIKKIMSIRGIQTGEEINFLKKNLIEMEIIYIKFKEI